MTPKYSNVYEGELPPVPPLAVSANATMLQRQLAQLADPPRFFLVTVPEDGVPHSRDFDAIEGLITAVRALDDTDVQIFMFVGHVIRRSDTVGAGDKLPFLLTPLGNHQLFDIPDPATLLPGDGFLGRSLPLPEVTAPDEDATNRPLRAMTLPDDEEEEPAIFPEQD